MHDLEEQERIDALKDWWKRWGSVISLLLGVLAIALAGWQGWRYYQRVETRDAAQAFAAIEASRADPKKLREAAARVMEQHPRTPYAAKAGLLAARASYASGDAKSAAAQLEWVATHADDDGMRDLAQLRRAALALDQKRYDDAKQWLAKPHGKAFEALYLDMQGDVAAARGETKSARAAYQSALAKFGKDEAYRRIVEIKLNALGEA